MRVCTYVRRCAYVSHHKGRLQSFLLSHRTPNELFGAKYALPFRHLNLTEFTFEGVSVRFCSILFDHNAIEGDVAIDLYLLDRRRLRHGFLFPHKYPMMSSAIYCLRQSVIFCAILITSQQPGSASAFVVGAAHRNRCTRSERQGKKISASSVARKTANMDLDGPTQEVGQRISKSAYILHLYQTEYYYGKNCYPLHKS